MRRRTGFLVQENYYRHTAFVLWEVLEQPWMRDEWNRRRELDRQRRPGRKYFEKKKIGRGLSESSCREGSQAVQVQNDGSQSVKEAKKCK